MGAQHIIISSLALGSPVIAIWLALPDGTYSSPQDLHISWLWWSEVFTKELNRVILYFSFFIILLHRLANVYLYQLFNVFIHVISFSMFNLPCQCLYLYFSCLLTQTLLMSLVSILSFRPFRPTWSLFYLYLNLPNPGSFMIAH